MLKYCEAYRTMRESLCREHSQENFCRTDTHYRPGGVVDPHKRLSLGDSKFSSPARNNNYHISKEEMVKSSCEDVETLDKPSCRQSISFGDEFTFSPRLNTASVRMAKERTGRAHEAVERRTAAIVAEAEVNFTFKPKVSSRSEKIVQGLKTSFFERQLIHVAKQKKMLDEQVMMQSSQLSQARLSPVIRPSKHTKQRSSELSKTERCHMGGEIINEIEKDALTKSAPDCLTTVKKQGVFEKIYLKCSSTDHINFRDKSQAALHGNRAKTQQSPEEFVQNSPYSCSVENLALKHNNQALARHRRLKTYPGVSDKKDNLLGDVNSKNKEKNTEGHKRASTIDGAGLKGQYHNIPLFDRLRQSKERAENAMKDNKVFVCHGPYPIVRASLRKRGWVEKHFKGCPAAAVNRDKNNSNTNLQERQDVSEDEEFATEENTKKLSNRAVNKMPQTINKKLLTDSERLDEHDGYENMDDSTIWNAGYEGEDCEYTLLSRFCRNATASFFWTCKRDDIDFKYLSKDQMANHFSKAYSFTTKVGLCTHLKNLSWFENARSDTFFPRCHRLGSDEEKEAFIDDYRLTSACNILKWLVKHSRDQSRAAVHSIFKAKSLTSVRTDPFCTSNQKPSSKDRFRPKSQRAKSSLGVGEDSSTVGQVPSRAVTLALQACKEFIMRRMNEDIDQLSEGMYLTYENWQELIGYSYQVIHEGKKIEGAQDFSEKCQEMLKEMRLHLPQLDLDGVRNVWIIKPGAKSRGRGIMCMDRLEDILSLVSSTVKKENRWIVQKYIECPLLIYNTKFDIRQWFLVTDWNPLTLWFYKDCYLRFCSQEFTLDNFEPCIHLANNSIQKHYQNGVRDKRLPENNMWSSDDFREYLRERGKGYLWEKVVYPGMRQAIVYTLECCQMTLEARKNSFELYGADFMLSEDCKPWLIEINSSPAMSASTMVTRKLCANVIEDTMKVVLDRREDKNCDTGRFELAFKQPYIDAPPYIGITLTVNGTGIPENSLPFRHQLNIDRLLKLSKPREKRDKTTEQKDSKAIKSRIEPVSENTVEGGEHEHEQDRTKPELRDVVLVKMKEKSLTLNCSNRKSDRNCFLAERTRQTRSLGNRVDTRAKFSRSWNSVEVLDIEGKQNGTKRRQLRTLNMNTGIRTAQKKQPFEKNRTKSNNRLKFVKKSRMSRVGHEGTQSKLQPRIITIPDVGVPRTILRYTDKRFRQTKSMPTGMEPEAKVRKDFEVVK